MLQPNPRSPPGARRLLVPGRNCWRIEHAHRFSLLIDAAAYFRALRAALAQARHSIFILGWDIDSRMRLVPEGAHDGLPEPLGDFLHTIVARRRGLHAYVLDWDFAMLYALEREWLPVYKLGWRTHRRLHFRLDNRHPITASHHQKIVVIDDRLAFVGGIDLTRRRWDTSEHACTQPLRVDPEGNSYPPFHDIQAMFDGAAACALSELARERWRRATGRTLPPAHLPAQVGGGVDDPWPSHVEPDIEGIELGIARTEPPFEERAPIGEILQLHLDAIAAARRHILIENQYFTSGLVGAALEKRIAEPAGPELAVISRRVEEGWLEEVTMGVLRARLHRRLRAADALGQRYRMYCPLIPGLDEESLNVHSKLMAVDDQLLTVGSANLNNRSMVLDTECNVVLETAGDARVAAAIAAMRDRLLAEHLAASRADIAQQFAQCGSLLGTIETLRHQGRSLLAIEPSVSADIDGLVPDHALIDPEQPVDADRLVAQLLPHETRRPASRRLIRLGLGAAAVAGLALGWRWTPLADWVSLESLVNLGRALQLSPFTPLWIMAAYLVAGLCAIPVTLMIAMTGVVFGPVTGGLYALLGSLLGAAASYLLGAWLGRDAVRRLAGPRINRLSERIGRRGVMAVVLLRMLPIAPFTLVNLVAGASHIRLRDFMLGSAIGMAPGVLMTVTFVHQVVGAIRHPGLGTAAAAIALAFVLIALGLFLNRRLAHDDPHDNVHDARES